MADEKNVKSPGTPVTISDDLTAKIAASVAAAVAEATIKVQERLNPSEQRSPSVTSPYNPEGLAKRPKLRCRYIFCNAELDENFMTNAEIELVNQVVKPGDYRKNQWHVKITRDSSDKETVFIDLPVKTIDQRMELPNSLTAIISEILAEQARPAAA